MSNNKSNILLQDKHLHRFWFTFKKPLKYNALSLGCGITAYDHSDASDILKKNVFVGQDILEIESITVDIDIQTLDQKHIIPNMGLVTNRGVWFPLGY